jgi:dihydrofolate reductase
MSNLCVYSFSISIDGYGAGPRQSRDNPLGVGGMALHQWAFATRTFCEMHGREGGATGIDDDFARRGFENIGAWILGRNMFGPVRGPWPDDTWKDGGVATIRQFLQAGLIDHMHLAVSPVLLGSGENVLAGIDVPRLGFEVAEHVASPNATPIVLNKRK